MTILEVAALAVCGLIHVIGCVLFASLVRLVEQAKGVDRALANRPKSLKNQAVKATRNIKKGENHVE